MLRLHGLVTIMTLFLNQTLLGFVSHLNAHGIHPLEFFPSFKAVNFLKLTHPLIVLSFSSDLTVKLSITRSLTYRVFTSKRIRAYQTKCYPGKIAATLMGFCPSKACPILEIEKISPFILSQAWYGRSLAQPLDPLLRVLLTWDSCLISFEMACFFRVLNLVCFLND